MYLVDTDIMSAGSPSKRQPPEVFLSWVDRNSERLFISAITIAEIEGGISKLWRKHARKKASALAEWLETLLHLYGDRVLPFDVAAARIAGRLSDRVRSKGQDPGFPDLAIAATAVAHGLTVLTENLRHFASLGVPAHNPFQSLPKH